MSESTGRVLTMGSLFDGIGGFPLAAIRSGIEPLWASEIEAFPIAVTKKHFPNMVHVGDITQLNGAELPPVDIICGGSPCQDLSVAGARAGLAGERSGLFLEQIRIIKEMRYADKQRGRPDLLVRPRYGVWENVPGAFSSAEGEDFKVVLQSFLQVEEPHLHVIGPETGRWEYSGAVLGLRSCVAWVTWDAQYLGVPQRRRRIFLIADFAGYSPLEILFIPDCLQGNPAPVGGTGERIAEEIENRADDPGGPLLLG